MIFSIWRSEYPGFSVAMSSMRISVPYGKVSNPMISLPVRIVTVVCPYPISIRQFVDRENSVSSMTLGRISGSGMSEIARLPRLDMIDLITLNSLDGTNTLSTVSRTRLPANQIGLVTFFPSTDIAMIVDETRRRSSLDIPNCLRLLVRARS